MLQAGFRKDLGRCRAEHYKLFLQYKKKSSQARSLYYRRVVGGGEGDGDRERARGSNDQISRRVRQCLCNAASSVRLRGIRTHTHTTHTHNTHTHNTHTHTYTDTQSAVSSSLSFRPRQKDETETMEEDGGWGGLLVESRSGSHLFDQPKTGSNRETVPLHKDSGICHSVEMLRVHPCQVSHARELSLQVRIYRPSLLII